MDDDVDFHGDYLIKQSGKRWRVYEDSSYYSQTSGGVSKRGKVMKDADDRIISFETKQLAEQWIDDGCKIWPYPKTNT